MDKNIETKPKYFVPRLGIEMTKEEYDAYVLSLLENKTKQTKKIKK